MQFNAILLSHDIKKAMYRLTSYSFEKHDNSEWMNN